MSRQSAVVSQTFIDRYTQEKYDIGSEYVTDDPQRLSLLQEKGFLHETKQSFQEEMEKTENEKEEFPKHVGGGYYELADGSKVKGKEKAYSKHKEG